MQEPSLRRYMGLGSAVMLVVGSVIGSGIFMKPLDVSRNLPDEAWIYGGWAVLGLVCLCGALAYGELSGMIPEAGGQYAFLRAAYGPFVGFLYGWCLLLAINTGTLAALAVTFASNLANIVALGPVGRGVAAAGMILVLAGVNHFGVRWGALLQNTSTLAKLAALSAIVLAGFLLFDGAAAAEVEAEAAAREPWPVPDLGKGLVLAAVALFWAYEGWHQLSFSAAEMKAPERNLPRGLVLGIGLLIVVYLLVNAVYLHAVPLEEMRWLEHEDDVPEEAIERIFGGASAQWLAALICLSVFGASNPNMLSAPRAFYAMARDGLVPPALMSVHRRWRSPWVAIWVQTAWALVLLLVLRTFRDITEFVVFAALIFYGLVVAGVFVLRFREPGRRRPYRCLGYPVTPALFIAVVVFVDVRLLLEAGERENALIGLGILAAGAAAWPLTRRWRTHRAP